MPGLKILLIDDEEELVSTLQERLRMRNMEAEIATDGHSALERMRNEAFDVVVVDMKMPGLDGLDVRDTIHRLYPQVNVLLVTGHGAEGKLSHDQLLTDPEEAEEFVARTGVDALARHSW